MMINISELVAYRLLTSAHQGVHGSLDIRKGVTGYLDVREGVPGSLDMKTGVSWGSWRGVLFPLT